MKIHANLERCIGAGLCVMTAPEIFDQGGDDGRVVLLNEQPSQESENAVREAVDLCPAQALAIRNES